MVALFALFQVRGSGFHHPQGAERVPLVGGDHLVARHGQRVGVQFTPATLLTKVLSPPNASTDG